MTNAQSNTGSAATAGRSVLDEIDSKLLHELRSRHRTHRAARKTVLAPPPPPSLGARIADVVAEGVGSWRFILIQSAVLVLWLVGNAYFGRDAWDPFPFILLNLLLSFQAAYTAPVIMMSQNRQAAVDRQRAENDYDVNVKAELEIELLHQKIDLMREQEILALTRAVTELAARFETAPRTGKAAPDQ